MADEKKLIEVQLIQERVSTGKWINTILDAMKARFGSEVSDVIDEVVAKETRQMWTEIAKRETSHTIDDLIRLLWEPLKTEGLEYTNEHREDGVQMRCTRCPSADIAKQIGNTEWSYHFFCSSDPYIVEGFNPKMGFRRTKTIMQGDEYCDHFYYMKK